MSCHLVGGFFDKGTLFIIPCPGPVCVGVIGTLYELASPWVIAFLYNINESPHARITIREFCDIKILIAECSSPFVYVIYSSVVLQAGSHQVWNLHQ